MRTDTQGPDAGEQKYRQRQNPKDSQILRQRQSSNYRILTLGFAYYLF